MPSSYAIGEHFEQFIKRQVEGGRYASASEVVRNALRLLEEEEQRRAATLEALRADVRKGLASGKGKPADAFQILHAAQDPGVFFKEDGRSGGVSLEGVDPELAEAVREARALLEPVPGIDRVFPGKNDENASIVVVVRLPIAS